MINSDLIYYELTTILVRGLGDDVDNRRILSSVEHVEVF